MIGNAKTKKNYNRGSNFVKIKCHLSLKRMTKFHACRVVARENENISNGCLIYTHHLFSLNDGKCHCYEHIVLLPGDNIKRCRHIRPLKSCICFPNTKTPCHV